jgi:hypothetical protein
MHTAHGTGQQQFMNKGSDSEATISQHIMHAASMETCASFAHGLRKQIDSALGIDCGC